MGMTRIVGAALAFLVVFADGAPASAAMAGARNTCARELALTETSLRRTLIHLQTLTSAGPDERCNAYREHLDVVSKARDVFTRCSSGPARDKDVGQLDSAIDGFSGVIAKSCGPH
jgi:hypothetical protein